MTNCMCVQYLTQADVIGRADRWSSTRTDVPLRLRELRARGGQPETSCRGCHRLRRVRRLQAMYWVPVRPLGPVPPRLGDEMKAIGGPRLDSADALKRDAAEAAEGQ